MSRETGSDEYDFAKNPRGKMFAGWHNTVTDISSFQNLMQINTVQNDRIDRNDPN